MRSFYKFRFFYFLAMQILVCDFDFLYYSKKIIIIIILNNLQYDYVRNNNPL